MGTVADAVAWPPLSPETTVFRAYAFPDWFDSKRSKIQPKTFYRKSNEAGLSIGLSREGILTRYAGAAGMCRLSAGTADIPGSGIQGSVDPLTIVQDELDHANIYGVPTREEDQQKAIRIAKYLVRIAQHDSMVSPKSSAYF